MMTDLPHISGFRLEKELGWGAMGRVFAAEATKDLAGLQAGDQTALKLIRRELLLDSNCRAQFDREMRIGKLVHDPHLMRVFGEGTTSDGQPFVTMELLEGQSLDSVAPPDSGVFEVDQAVRIAIGIARGLKALHEKGIIHRDLKPANVMICRDGEVKLMDFGLARVLDDSARLTRKGEFVGTVAYSSPEQIGGIVGPPSDLWALGIILYEMLAGIRPFVGETIAEIFYAIQIYDPEPLTSRNPQVPESVARIVSRLLEKDISRRLGSAEEAIAALEGRAGPALEEFLSRAGEGAARPTKRMSAVLPFATHFQGRKEEIDLALSALADREIPAVLATGLKGLGKSAMIAEIARLASASFAKGELYLDLQKLGLSWQQLCERTFREFGYDPEGQRMEDALTACLKKHPLLLVIDSAEVFSPEDWAGFVEFLKRVEHARAAGGFDAFPSSILVGTRVIPQAVIESGAREIPLMGLSNDEGAELLRKLIRDEGPPEWRSTEEREWISSRIGGHPEILRLIAVQARQQDYRQLKRAISKMSGKFLVRVDKVIGWAVERLGEDGRRLVPFIACFTNLNFEAGELAAAAGQDVNSLEFEEGMEQLQYAAGLIHWDHADRVYRYHASLPEWTRLRLEDPGALSPGVELMDEEELYAAQGRVAEHWEARFGEMPDDPQNLEDLKPILSAIEYRIARREAGIALKHFADFSFRTALGGEQGEDVAKLLQRFGLFSDWLGIAQRLASVADREHDPLVWGKTINILGVMWFFLPSGDRGENLQKAIDCWERALQTVTREVAPSRWAKNMMNLGNAWSYLPTGDKGENVQKAIRCYEQSLEVFTREADPFKWAKTMMNLGNAWVYLPTGDKGENTERAIHCFEQTLEVWTRESVPSLWAMTMSNLGISWERLPTGDRGANVANAIECFEQSLEVYTRETTPFDWAWAMNYLGVGWREKPDGNREENLNKAVKFHLAALEVNTLEDYPEEYAANSHFLGLTWLAVAGIKTGREEINDALDKAIGCFTNAMEVWTEAAHPHDHPLPKAGLVRARTWKVTGADPGEETAHEGR